MTQKQVFLMYLQKVGAYENYFTNLERPFDYLINSRSMASWVSGDFNWAASPQPRIYWENISVHWRRMARSLNLETLEVGD